MARRFPGVPEERSEAPSTNSPGGPSARRGTVLEAKRPAAGAGELLASRWLCPRRLLYADRRRGGVRMRRLTLVIVVSSLLCMAHGAASAAPLLLITSTDVGSGLTAYDFTVDGNDGVELSFYVEVDFGGSINQIVSGMGDIDSASMRLPWTVSGAIARSATATSSSPFSSSMARRFPGVPEERSEAPSTNSPGGPSSQCWTPPDQISDRPPRPHRCAHRSGHLV